MTTTQPTTETLLIEVKNIKYYPGMSQETNAFNASLYIDGKKIGEAENQGHGGNTNYGAIHGPKQTEHAELIKQAEAQCAAMPAQVYDWGTIPYSLESLIDEAVQSHIIALEVKKLEKKTVNHLVWGNVHESHSIKWNIPIAEILKTEKGRKAIADSLRKNVYPLSEGFSLINKNIPADILAEFVK